MKKSESEDEKIKKLYTDPANPGAFAGITGFLKSNKNLDKNNVKKILEGVEA